MSYIAKQTNKFLDIKRNIYYGTFKYQTFISSLTNIILITNYSHAILNFLYISNQITETKRDCFENNCSQVYRKYISSWEPLFQCIHIVYCDIAILVSTIERKCLIVFTTISFCKRKPRLFFFLSSSLRLFRSAFRVAILDK